ncbi:hypothetical protein B0T11DRAFT_268607 [Plectosphaerella cucumerina]|uniref:Uncharacterized protein n=1 Tax=Plectosphaerella cucumerina TaxID=40658 RepID=A0A8K0TTR5_9PEZI|nr:hypothetical protein B0T11DRAFT_268607 [Plectosphaerella cucumerina]
MSPSNDDHLDSFGLSCPSGGDFYVCDKAALKFIGCCTSDPCSNGSGKCPNSDLRVASFSADKYANIPEQSCDDNRREKVWYTCRDNDPPFLGCCASVPCGTGCPKDHLIQAVLSDDEVKRMAFLPPSSTSSADPSGTPTSTSGASTGDSQSSGLSTGAIAGIAVGGAAALIIIGVLVWLCRRRVRKSNEGHQQPGPEMSYHDNSMPNSPAPFGHIRDSHISSATTAVPHSYQSTPTSPDFHSKTYAQYSHPHYQHPSSPPPPSAQHPPSVYSQYAESDNGYQYHPVHPRHLSHMSGISGMSDPNATLQPVSEMDGGDQHQRVELPGNDTSGSAFGRQH